MTENEQLKLKLLGPVNRAILALTEIHIITLELALKDEVSEREQLDLIKAAKGYRKFKEALEVLRDSLKET